MTCGDYPASESDFTDTPGKKLSRENENDLKGRQEIINCVFIIQCQLCNIFDKK